MADKYSDSMLSYKMSWRLGPPDAAAVAAEQAKESARLSVVINSAAKRQQGPLDIREAPSGIEQIRRSLAKNLEQVRHKEDIYIYTYVYMYIYIYICIHVYMCV